MVDPNLKEYLTNALNQNHTPAELKQALLASGWTQDAIDEAFKSLFVNAQESPSLISQPTPLFEQGDISLLLKDEPPVKKSRKGLLIGIGSTVVALLILTVTPVAFAEHGYLPAFSKIYRKTLLPLLWNGTSGNPSISLLQAVQAVGKSTQLRDQAQYSLTIVAADKEKPVSLEKWPLLAKAINKQNSSTYADTASTDEPNDLPLTSPKPTQSTTPTNYLPLNLHFNALTEYNPQRNYHLKWTIDIGDLATKVPFIKQIFPKIKQSNTVEGSLIKSANSAYFRSSFIPYLNPTDQDKWLHLNLPADQLKEIENDQQKTQAYSKDDLNAYQEILSSAITDQGIVRRDNQPYAKYHIHISPTILQQLADRPTLSKYKVALGDLVTNKLTVDGDVWLETQTFRLAFSDMTSSLLFSDFNVLITYHLEDALDYTGSSAISAPAPSQIIDDGQDYFQKISDQALKGL